MLDDNFREEEMDYFLSLLMYVIVGKWHCRQMFSDFKSDFAE